MGERVVQKYNKRGEKEEIMMKEDEANVGERIVATAQGAMRQVLKERGMTYQRLADKLGTKLQNVIDKMCKRHSMSIALLVQYCEAADCEVVIRSKLKDRKEWVLTDGLEGQNVTK